MKAKNDPNELPPPRDYICRAIVEQIYTLIYQKEQRYSHKELDKTKELLVKLLEQL